MNWKVKKPRADGRSSTFGEPLPDGKMAVTDDAVLARKLKDFGYITATTDLKPGLYDEKVFDRKARRPRTKVKSNEPADSDAD